MKVGILGSGLMGGKLGILFSRAGHDVVFSYARSEQKLKRLAREANGTARAGTPAEAVSDADAVLLARAAYHLGNRHIAVQLMPDRLRFLADHVLAEMVAGLGLRVNALVAPFEPEGGAYGHQHAHGGTSGPTSAPAGQVVEFRGARARAEDNEDQEDERGYIEQGASAEGVRVMRHH